MDLSSLIPSAETVKLLLEAVNWGRLFALSAFLILMIGIMGLVRKTLQQVVTRHFDAHMGLLVSRVFFYLASGVVTLVVLHEAGLKLGALLGAAGVFSLALGFAAQAGLSNIISGVFLYWERPFKVGDLIRVDDNLGIVLSIDLMSLKLRKLDNVYIRIPNDQVLKTSIQNITRFPIRRMDFQIGCAYHNDPEHILRVLKDVCMNNTLVFDEPEPYILFDGFGDSSINFTVGVWFDKSQYSLVRNSILCDIKKRFDAEGIEIPFPQRALTSGPNGAPFPIRIVQESPAPVTPPEPVKGTVHRARSSGIDGE